MLSRTWVESYQRFYDSFANAAQADGLLFRIEETNSYFNGGAKDVSNTFASALWGLDYMHWWASHGAGAESIFIQGNMLPLETRTPNVSTPCFCDQRTDMPFSR